MLLYATTIPATIEPLVPALQNNLLLPVHVAVAIVAYGTFTVAFAAAVLYLVQTDGAGAACRSRELLDEISYRAVVVGFPFLTLDDRPRRGLGGGRLGHATGAGIPRRPRRS